MINALKMMRFEDLVMNMTHIQWNENAFITEVLLRKRRQLLATTFAHTMENSWGYKAI
jgi:hypothetical protein